MSRSCPNCRAPIPETSIVCEYCGSALEVKVQSEKKELQTENVLETALKNANGLISTLQRYNSPSYRLLGNEGKIIDQTEEATRNLEVFASENKKVQTVISELRQQISSISEKVRLSEKHKRLKRILLTLLYFIGIESLMAIIFWGAHKASADNLNTFFVGGLGIIGLVVGLFGGFFGAIIGVLAGGVLGMLLQWILVSIVGNIIFAIIWNAIFIFLYFNTIKYHLP
jgi:hypothetical protein